MVILEKDASVEVMLQTIIECGHSRFPVIGEDRDEVVGILLAKDLLRLYVTGDQRQFDLEEFLRPATYIPESKRLDTLLKEFRSSRNHMAIVVDEYGGTAGLLTIEDVLEEIVGDIDDEHDPEQDKPIQKTGDDTWHVRALTRIDDFNEHFEVELDDEDYDTIGGLIMHELGRLPRKGETMVFGGFGFRIMQADRRRIHNVEVSRAAEPGDDSA
jgi:magnesium and cobalt transporter